MKTSLLLALTLVVTGAMAQQSLSGSTGGTLGMPQSASPSANSVNTATTSGTLGGTNNTASIPQAGTSAGSPQNAGPLNSAPNGSGGTYGYPNSPIDPNTVNPGLPQQPYFSGPFYNYGNGTTSGTTMPANPSGSPFAAPPGSTMPATNR